MSFDSFISTTSAAVPVPYVIIAICVKKSYCTVLTDFKHHFQSVFAASKVLFLPQIISLPAH